MLGAPCSPCCDTPCSACTAGKLPDTVTVTFEGYPNVGPAFAALSVSFESCFGFGATANVTTEDGVITAVTVIDGGSEYAKLARVEPTITADGTGGSGADITVTFTQDSDLCGLPYWTITGLTVVDGGAGYTDNGIIVFTLGEGTIQQSAAFAFIQTSRAEPELTIEPPEDSGTGAEFTVSVTAFDTNPETWFISSITVDDGGTGYTDGQVATIGLGSGDVEEAPASLTIINVRNEPELTLTGEADLTVNVTSLAGSPALWKISSITVTEGGTGYSDFQILTVTLGPSDVERASAFLQIRTVRSEPTLTASTPAGDGAVLTIAVTQSGSSPDVWSAASVTVSNPGSGYTDGDTWTISASLGITNVSGLAIATVNEGGGLVSLAISFGGEFFFDTGVIQSVDVLYGGEYFLDTGIIDLIAINYGGIYYKALGDIASLELVDGGFFYAEDAEGPPLVVDVTVTLNQIPPSFGVGATFTATVNNDPDSPTFGEIASVTVDDGGSGYEATGANNSFCMGQYMNGREFVLARRKFLPESLRDGSAEQIACRYVTFLCDPLAAGVQFDDQLALGAYTSGKIEFTYRYDANLETGFSFLEAPHVNLTAPELVADCSDFELQFPAASFFFGGQNIAFNNVTATVVSGGEIDLAFDDTLLAMQLENTFFPVIGPCGSCCLNAEPTPAEVTVGITNLVEDAEDGVLPDGDYVCSRDSALESSNPNLGNHNATIWRGETAGANLPGRFLLVIIEPCASLLRTGPFQQNTYVDVGCGDTCFEKCRVRIVRLFGAATNPGCDGCVDGPMCAPPPGSYTMVDQFQGAPFYTATIA